MVLLSGGKPSLDRGSVEHHMAAGEAVDLWIRQRREIVPQDGRSKRFQSDPVPGQDGLVSKHVGCDHEITQPFMDPGWSCDGVRIPGAGSLCD